MSDATGRQDIREEDSLGADGLQGFPKETGTERSEGGEWVQIPPPVLFTEPLILPIQGRHNQLRIMDAETRLANINHPLAMSRTFSLASFSVNPSCVGTFQLRIRCCLGREDGESKRP